MRKVIAAECMALDGVTEAAGQWHFPYVSDKMVAEQSALMSETGHHTARPAHVRGVRPGLARPHQRRVRRANWRTS